MSIGQARGPDPRKLALLVVACGATAASIGAARLPAAVADVKTLWKFTNGTDGGGSGAALIMDAAGNIYGTSFKGGANHLGTVFIIPPSSGTFTATPIWSFTGGADGAMPLGALIQDKAGNLYGTASGGGADSAGTVFELSPPSGSGGAWTETTLYTFTHGEDGGSPAAGLIADAKGALYGTTGSFGTGGFGTVFKLTPPAAGQTAWTETTLWDFTGGADGGNSYASLIIDTSGNLYGTATRGGTNVPDGVVFELSPPGNTGGAWTETTIWNFTGGDGAHPAAALIADKLGNLYGTCAFGGANQRGSAFELSPPANAGGAWTETIIWNFAATAGGADPFSALLADANGVLYGTTYGYSPKDLYTIPSTIFSLTPPPGSGTSWTEATLATLTTSTGLSVLAPLMADSHGLLYSTAILGGVKGGSDGFGTVFRLKGSGFAR
jgi:uncharacterized repeat protein (TIGR03803 family)